MSMTFAEMIASAQAAGSGPMDPPPAGEYNAVVVSANTKRSNSGKLQIGLLLRVEDEGPAKGNGLWDNQYLSPESPVAMGIWFRTFEALGIPTTWWGQFADSIDQAAAQAVELVKGKQVRITVKYEEWPKGSGQMDAKVKRIGKSTAVVASAAAAAPLGAAAPLAPAPVAPIAPAAPVVASVPQPPTAPF